MIQAFVAAHPVQAIGGVDPGNSGHLIGSRLAGGRWARGAGAGHYALSGERQYRSVQEIRIDRLGYVVVHAFGETLIALLGHRLRGHRDDTQWEISE